MEEICNVGYACDSCPYNKKKQKHRHEWEEKETQLKMKYIQCKTCKKISVPNKRSQIYVRRGKIHYHTKGAFGKRE
jgi:hypothetical protein